MCEECSACAIASESACAVGANLYQRCVICASVNLSPTFSFLLFFALGGKEVKAWSCTEMWWKEQHVNLLSGHRPQFTAMTHLKMSEMNLPDVSFKMIVLITCQNIIISLSSAYWWMYYYCYYMFLSECVYANCCALPYLWLWSHPGVPQQASLILM